MPGPTTNGAIPQPPTNVPTATTTPSQPPPPSDVDVEAATGDDKPPLNGASKSTQSFVSSGLQEEGEEEDATPDPDAVVVLAATWPELIRYWFILGWTAFGGPAAHIGMFQKLFVEKLKWCTYLVFTELLMLGQCIPGK